MIDTMPKKITILAYGSRGDVQPAIALAVGLQKRGYQVCLVAGRTYRDWIAQYQVNLFPSDFDAQKLMRSEEGADWVDSQSNLIRQLFVMRRIFRRYADLLLEEASQWMPETDLIISGIAGEVLADTLAEEWGVPLIDCVLQPPFLTTSDGRSMFDAPFPMRTSRLNKLFSQTATTPFMWRTYGRTVNNYRAKLGLAKLNRRQFISRRESTPTLTAYSEHVIPQPADWPPTVHSVGYLRLPDISNWQPDDALQRFLDEGDQPISIGFGSMVGLDPQRMTSIVIEAVQQVGCRAIILGGWGGLSSPSWPSSMFVLDEAPHDRFFPLVAAAVHHGGAGTTAATLMAGIPTFIVPHLADQPLWGRRVATLGVGPKPVGRSKLTADILADAITTMLQSDEMRNNARQLAATINSEPDGVSRACDYVDTLFGSQSEKTELRSLQTE